MNIEQLELVLDEMRAATFVDAATAEALVRKWAGQIGDAISEHLITELGGATGPADATPDLAANPSGHGWDDNF